MLIGIVLMLLAATLNASASVLQRRAASGEPETAAFSIGMFRDLLRRPVWLLGILAMLAGFIAHAVSISVSDIALVQPLLITELPLTLLLASKVFRVYIPVREWVAIGLATVGLAAFLACLAPSGGAPDRVQASGWLLGGGATGAGVAALVVLGYRGKREHRAAALGVATGGAFGLNSSLIAGVGAAVQGGGNLFTTWQTYAVAAVGPASFFLLQNALQSGNLVASQPGFTLTNPLVSVLFGVLVFGERGNGGAWLVGTVLGAILIGVGTILLSRSSLLDPDVRHTRGGGPREAPANGRPRPS